MKNIFSLLCIFLVVNACSVDDDQVTIDCGSNVIVNNNLYESVQNESAFQVVNAEIIGNCLEVDIASGGCDGSSWQVDLIDADIIVETLPEERYLKISFENQELCNAIVTRTFSFDIQALQTSQQSVLLNLENYEEQMLYEY